MANNWLSQEFEIYMARGKQKCNNCNNGWINIQERHACNACGGKGCIVCKYFGTYSRVVPRICSRCGGHGIIYI